MRWHTEDPDKEDHEDDPPADSEETGHESKSDSAQQRQSRVGRVAKGLTVGIDQYAPVKPRYPLRRAVRVAADSPDKLNEKVKQQSAVKQIEARARGIAHKIDAEQARWNGR